MGPVVAVPGVLSGERVDRVVALLSGYTRAQVGRLIAAGAVRVGGGKSRRAAGGSGPAISWR